MRLPTLSAVCFLLLATGTAPAADLFVEAESFQDRGGWKLDTQFIQEMGSPYLLAHGLGKPVDDATTTITVPAEGKYRIWVRTKGWVARWGAAPPPGKFKVRIGEDVLETTFGTQGKQWSWHDGGTVQLAKGATSLALMDQTGFDGRCDCLYLTTDLSTDPPAADQVLGPWRRQQLGLPDQPLQKGPYDLVVVGGGYAGMGAALSAARMGCKVALIQDRPVLGGNGSSEVRVWAKGNIRRGKFPRIGEIIDEFADNATKSPGTYEEFGDDLKERIVRAEPNIDLMLNHHAHDVTMKGDKIVAVTALDTRTGAEVVVEGSLFCDCTGHGWIGTWAGADLDMTSEGRMGMSNMWAWDELDQPTEFPETPWALDLNMADFPYPRDHHGQWFWESGFDKDAIGDAEAIRDWNLRAVYGAFNAMKNRDGAEDHPTAILTWVAYIGGPRESRRLMGDVVLTQEDIVSKRDFIDGCVPSTWSIDLHYPKEQYAKKFPDNPFISIAEHNRAVDRNYGYPVPYRCFYSRNINNLFMAGRCISVTHEALGTVRVMKTCGMMGEVVGKAASICAAEDCLPRDVYEDHLDDLVRLMHYPGKARRETPTSDIVVPGDAMTLAGPYGPPSGLDPAKIDGIVADDGDAMLSGKWQQGQGLKGFVGYGYRYAAAGTDATATFKLSVKSSGKYELLVFSSPHKNRSTRTRVTLRNGNFRRDYHVDQSIRHPKNAAVAGTVSLSEGDVVEVVLSTDDADGMVHADAVALRKVD
ncbi:FAD-dependent oxidoreductase [Crateriforma conspicua]|uniref:tRNA uridine 5-carboxymethylaminomethyl modification enzyme GidA n=1 Tax=Crateriforma conspicua TaxID=2527996 RepID=A0A5C5XSC0_9PLAN|nr:FAD-dependent oxidoreductase [Crateriforma conspicua]TWT65760.1 tRNA uridine 5-carboxymethylaminomethyl modification enzyme GidA [Crateriforma conspicua]